MGSKEISKSGWNKIANSGKQHSTIMRAMIRVRRVNNVSS